MIIYLRIKMRKTLYFTLLEAVSTSNIIKHLFVCGRWQIVPLPEVSLNPTLSLLKAVFPVLWSLEDKIIWLFEKTQKKYKLNPVRPPSQLS